MKLGEIVVDAVVAKLKAEMPGRVATINEEKSDELTLSAPSDAAYFTGRVIDFPEAPAIFVMEGPSRFKHEGAVGLWSVPDVIVHIAESDQTGQQLARRLQRQVRAVIESIVEGEPKKALTDSAFTIMPIRTIPGSVFEPSSRDGSWRAFYVVVFRAEQLEV